MCLLSSVQFLERVYRMMMCGLWSFLYLVMKSFSVSPAYVSDVLLSLCVSVTVAE